MSPGEEGGLAPALQLANERFEIGDGKFRFRFDGNSTHLLESIRAGCIAVAVGRRRCSSEVDQQ